MTMWLSEMEDSLADRQAIVWLLHSHDEATRKIDPSAVSAIQSSLLSLQSPQIGAGGP